MQKVLPVVYDEGKWHCLFFITLNFAHKKIKLIISICVYGKKILFIYWNIILNNLFWLKCFVDAPCSSVNPVRIYNGVCCEFGCEVIQGLWKKRCYKKCKLLILISEDTCWNNVMYILLNHLYNMQNKYFLENRWGYRTRRAGSITSQSKRGSVRAKQ